MEAKLEQEKMFDGVGKKNIYTCEKCFGHIVTVDRDYGTTPFIISHSHTGSGCDGMMKSSMYRVFDQNMKAGFEWYKPPVVQILTDGERDHVDNGGLLMRPVG